MSTTSLSAAASPPSSPPAIGRQEEVNPPEEEDSPILFTHPRAKIVKFELPAPRHHNTSNAGSKTVIRKSSRPSFSRPHSSSSSLSCSIAAQTISESPITTTATTTTTAPSSPSATEPFPTLPPPPAPARNDDSDPYSYADYWPEEEDHSSSSSSSGNDHSQHHDDIEIDAIASLPYHVPRHERILSLGPLCIHHVPGSMAFLQAGSGNVVKPLMTNSQCWCVSDGATAPPPSSPSSPSPPPSGEHGHEAEQPPPPPQQERAKAIFVIRVGKMAYYRIELPSESDEDRARIAALKRVLKGLVLFEETPCPFFRGSPDGGEAEAKVEEGKRRKSIRGHRRPWIPRTRANHVVSVSMNAPPPPLPPLSRMPDLSSQQQVQLRRPVTALATTVSGVSSLNGSAVPGPRHRAYSAGAYGARNSRFMPMKAPEAMTVADRIAAFEPRWPHAARSSSPGVGIVPLFSRQQDRSHHEIEVPPVPTSATERSSAEECQAQTLQNNPASLYSLKATEIGHLPPGDGSQDKGGSSKRNSNKCAELSTPERQISPSSAGTSASSTGISQTPLRGRRRCDGGDGDPSSHDAYRRSLSSSSSPPSPHSASSSSSSSIYGTFHPSSSSHRSPSSPPTSPSIASASVSRPSPSPSQSTNSTTTTTLLALALALVRFAYKFAILPPLHTVMLLVHLGTHMTTIKSSTCGCTTTTTNEGERH